MKDNGEGEKEKKAGEGKQQQQLTSQTIAVMCCKIKKCISCHNCVNKTTTDS